MSYTYILTHTPFHKNQAILYKLSCILFSLLSNNSWNSLHIKWPRYNSFFLTAKKYLIVWKSHNLYNHFFTIGHLLDVNILPRYLEYFYLKKLQIQMYPAHIPLQSYSSTIFRIQKKKEANATINLVYITTMYVFIFLF